MGSIIWSIIIGFVAGAIAKLIMPGKDPGGIIITIIIGIAGSLLFTWLGRMIGWYDDGETAGFIASILGAIVLLLIYRMIKGRGAARAIKD
ncbi:MAG: GlsB/YeaQ/YmgE family stress response membrane protein [Ignavibacteria bacterium]